MIIKLQKEKAVRIKVELPDTTVEYAKAFLIITNNARCYSSMIYKVYNNDGNDVYVVVPEQHEAAAKAFLEDLGEIKDVKKVQCFRPYIENMTDADFNRLYREDIDTEFLDIEVD